MLFIKETISTGEIKSIQNFFEEFETTTLNTLSPEEATEETVVNKYINTLVTNCYAKSINEIENTKIGNKVVRKRNLQQVMKESFFYGSNRFGNNFIA